MPEDATLDAFASSGESDGESDSEGESTATDFESTAPESDASDVTSEPSDVGSTESAEGSPVDPSDVDPARSTYEWSPDGGECADCGGSVERRWRADGQTEGGLVCADCKDW